MLNAIALRRPLPQLLKTDNGSEFAGKMLDKWVYARGSRIDFSRPGTPTDNATVESFNGRLRQESPERKLVHVAGGCTVQNRSLAHTL